MKTGLILCVGGCGCKVAEYLREEGFPDVAGLRLDVLDLDSPLSALSRTRFRSLRSGGHGAVDLTFLLKRISAADYVILIGSMAGNAGRLLLPLMATMARSCELPVSAILLLPFAFEGRKRRESAVQGSATMQLLTDHVAMLSNDDLLRNINPRAGILDAFLQNYRHISELCVSFLSETACTTQAVECATDQST